MTERSELLTRAQSHIETDEIGPRVAALRELEELLERHFPETPGETDISVGALASRTAVVQMLLGRVLAGAVEEHGLAEVLPLVHVLSENLEEVMMACLREQSVN
jgi:hypothetical protein